MAKYGLTVKQRKRQAHLKRSARSVAKRVMPSLETDEELQALLDLLEDDSDEIKLGAVKH